MTIANHGNGTIGNANEVSPSRFELFLAEGRGISALWGSGAVPGMRPTVTVQGRRKGYISRMPNWAANGTLEYLSIWRGISLDKASRGHPDIRFRGRQSIEVLAVGGIRQD